MVTLKVKFAWGQVNSLAKRFAWGRLGEGGNHVWCLLIIALCDLEEQRGREEGDFKTIIWVRKAIFMGCS